MQQFILFLALTIANYLYQYITSQNDWSRAAERSYFQGAAILIMWLVERGVK